MLLIPPAPARSLWAVEVGVGAPPRSRRIAGLIAADNDTISLRDRILCTVSGVVLIGSLCGVPFYFALVSAFSPGRQLVGLIVRSFVLSAVRLSLSSAHPRSSLTLLLESRVAPSFLLNWLPR